MKSAGLILLALLCARAPLAAQGARILLTPSRLHRLQRDRERATPRWANFERRVATVTDSPERGFELALYATVAADQARAHDAIAWALAHPCERRQVSLVLNWLREMVPDTDRQRLQQSGACASAAIGQYSRLRDDFFWAVTTGRDNDFKPPSLTGLADLPAPEELYALIEFLDAYRTRESEDLRRTNAAYFSRLPELFLLASSPETLNHPSSQAHLAALALVSLNPNLEGSQFLQSWAMELRFQINDGPGLAYELLWANPYLPGVGYQNLQPWLYFDQTSNLWARADWTEGACWVHIAPGQEESRNCPEGWATLPAQFGGLLLRPLEKGCFEPGPERLNEHVILRTLKPQQKLSVPKSQPPRLISSDAAGLRLLQPDDYSGVCVEAKARGR